MPVADGAFADHHQRDQRPAGDLSRRRSTASGPFPILIGIFEATSIDRRVKGYPSPRPLTHDLIVSVVESLGARVPGRGDQRAQGAHVFRQAADSRTQGELIEIDARPSDAIAVAVTCNPPLPIYVNEEVLNDVLNE